jgi:hypothetical protein
MSEPLVRPTAERKLFAASASADLVRADVERREPVGLEPDAHGERASAQDVRALHAFERGQARLHDAHEIIRDLVRLQNVRRETQIAEANCESADSMLMTGTSASGGRSLRTWSTLELISESALLAS